MGASQDLIINKGAITQAATGTTAAGVAATPLDKYPYEIQLPFLEANGLLGITYDEWMRVAAFLYVCSLLIKTVFIPGYKWIAKRVKDFRD